MNTSRTPRALLVTAAVALATTLGAESAHAGILVNTESAKNCTTQVLEQPFKRWLDPLTYTLMPDGGLEAGAKGWALSGGAKVVNGNETFQVGGAGDSKALSLPPGSSAVTPVACAGLDKPIMRFFSKSSGGILSLSVLSVEVLFETAGGKVLSLPVGVALPATKWQPSLPLPVLASLLPLLPGQQTPIAFRFRPVGGATWTIDDVYLDPYRR